MSGKAITTSDVVVEFEGKKMLIVNAAVVETKPWKRGKNQSNANNVQSSTNPQALANR